MHPKSHTTSSKAKILAVFIAATSATLPLTAFEIAIDYSFDSTGFFSSNTDARATLERAASDLSFHLTDTLTSVNSLQSSVTQGGATQSVTWNVSFTNPGTSAIHTITAAPFTNNKFVVYAGTATLGVNQLAVGGTLGGGFSISRSGTPVNGATLTQALADASNAVMLRGSSVAIQSLTTDISGNPLTLKVGPLGGNLFFDTSANWHFDSTTLVGAGKMDFYTASLHELMHTLGAGTSSAWDSTRIGANWLGLETNAIYGSGVGLLTSNGQHTADGVLGFKLGSDNLQAPVLDASLAAGERRFLTETDLAMLHDMGYGINFSAIPEPGTTAIGFGAASILIAVWNRKRGSPEKNPLS